MQLNGFETWTSKLQISISMQNDPHTPQVKGIHANAHIITATNKSMPMLNK